MQDNQNQETEFSKQGKHSIIEKSEDQESHSPILKTLPNFN